MCISHCFLICELPVVCAGIFFSTCTGREMKEVKVTERSYFNGKTVREADIHEKTGVVLVGIEKAVI